MLQYAVYSVITPEGCAAILWKDQSKVKEAAEALKLTAADLYGLGIIDRVIDEPAGGAHRNPQAMAEELRRVLYEELDYLQHFDAATLVDKRLKKYKKIGYFLEETP